MPPEPNEKSAANRRAGEVIRELWDSPPPHAVAAARGGVVSTANALWLEGRAVADAAQKTGICPLGCEDAARGFTSPPWKAQELHEVMLTRNRGRARGFVARFRRGDGEWTIRCEKGEGRGDTVCIGVLLESDRLVATYSPDSYAELSQHLRVACGGLALVSGEGGRRAERWATAAGTHFTEMPFSGRLPPSAVHASTALSGHGPTLAVDDRVDTAWAEGAPGPGPGQWIELRWTTPVRIGEVGVFPGFGKSGALFRANARIKRARIVFSDGHTVEVAFDDEPAFQLRTVSAPGPWDDWSALVTSMRIEILEVYVGEKYEDACISEIVAFAPM